MNTSEGDYINGLFLVVVGGVLFVIANAIADAGISKLTAGAGIKLPS